MIYALKTIEVYLAIIGLINIQLYSNASTPSDKQTKSFTIHDTILVQSYFLVKDTLSAQKKKFKDLQITYSFIFRENMEKCPYGATTFSFDMK